MFYLSDPIYLSCFMLVFVKERKKKKKEFKVFKTRQCELVKD